MKTLEAFLGFSSRKSQLPGGKTSARANHHSIELQAIDQHDKRPANPSLWSSLAAFWTKQNLRTLIYFIIWFALSVVYNICNKAVDKELGMSVFLAAIQMATGVPIITCLWLTGVRKPPTLSDNKLFFMLCLMALFHTATHLGGVVSMGGEGAVYLTQVIKATEPVFTALLSVVILGQVYAWQVYLALLGVCAGCIIVSVFEAKFLLLPLVFALISSLGASLRGTLSKEKLKTVPAECNLKAQNLYYVLTIISTIYCAICFAAVDAHDFTGKFSRALHTKGHGFIWGHIFGSGLSYFLYNEVAFLALESVSPVTHAIGSTSKRVFIIAASLIVFPSKIKPWGYAGMTIAIVCVLVYSLAKIRYPGRSIKTAFSSKTVEC